MACFLAICCIQCIELFKEYLSYRTVQFVYISADHLSLPAITFCHPNSTTLISFVEDSVCTFLGSTYNFCNCTKYPVIYSKKENSFCATYFSQLLEKNKELKNGLDFKVNFAILNFFTSFTVVRFALHSPLMPPQLVDLESEGCVDYVEYFVTHEILMPTPYDTKCLKCNHDKRIYKSEFDCNFRCQMKKGSSYVYQSNPLFETNKSVHVKANKSCKKHCHYRYYGTRLVFGINSQSCRFLNGMNYKSKFYFAQDTDDVFIAYQEKMSLLYTFIQSGGLLGLWFGFSFVQIPKFLEYRITAKDVIFSIYLLFNAICIYQIIAVVAGYFRYETSTNVVTNNYETVGVMPQINIVSEFSLEPKVVGKYVIRRFIKSTIALNNGTLVPLNVVAITYKSDRIEYTFAYSRKDIKLIQYVFKNIFKYYPKLYFSAGVFKVVNYATALTNPIKEISIGHQTFESLPPPFGAVECVVESQNSDYFDNIHFGEERCQLECVKGLLHKEYNCSFSKREIYFLKNSSVLSSKDTFPLCKKNLRRNIVNELYGSGDECTKECLPSCVERKYLISYTYENLPLIPNRNFSIEFANNFAIVFKTNPRMNPFDLFYEVCSLAAFWLGCSILNCVLMFCRKLLHTLSSVWYND